MPEDRAKLPFDQDLFDLLVCPEARMPLKFAGDRLISTDPKTRRSYRVDNGIPVMLLEESLVLDEQTWKDAMSGEGPVGGGVAVVQARHRPTA